ncbi:hypothetical protein QR680_007770 [Steinernema hermaphroditum]|uniref:Uncharacterized protein n=1 Tax=Steinernema hermaphroditum TaxID=289476 RepID=A0AA39M6X5_9BILA|nr:hypothetical protein QR680_007770 [Steinernema hermaphroditum]
MSLNFVRFVQLMSEIIVAVVLDRVASFVLSGRVVVMDGFRVVVVVKLLWTGRLHTVLLIPIWKIASKSTSSAMLLVTVCVVLCFLTPLGFVLCGKKKQQSTTSSNSTVGRQPYRAPLTYKEQLIKMGLTKGIHDYPTLEDILSDWSSHEDKDEKDEREQKKQPITKQPSQEPSIPNEAKLKPKSPSPDVSSSQRTDSPDRPLF